MKQPTDTARALIPAFKEIHMEVMDNRQKLIDISQGQVNPVKLWTAFELSTHQLPKLRDCANTPEGRASVISGLLKCADLGLMPNTLNLAWMLPFVEHTEACKKSYYQNCKCPIVQAQFIPGYKGYQQCAQQSDPAIYKFSSRVVYKYERDHKLFEFINNGEDIKHVPCLDDDFQAKDEDLILAYTKIYRTDGNFYLHYLRRAEFLKKARRTKSIQHFKKAESPAEEKQNEWYFFKDNWGKWKEITGAWRTDFAAMVLKTVIREMAVRHLLLNPISRIGKAVAYDEEGVENPMQLSFNGPLLDEPKPKVDRVAKMVARVKSEQPGSKDNPVDITPPSEDVEPETGEDNSEKIDFDAKIALTEWRTTAAEKGKQPQFDAECKRVLSDEKVSRIDQLSVDKQKQVVAAMAKFVEAL